MHSRTAAILDRVLTIGPFTVSTGNCTITQGDENHKVSPRSMDVLVYLLEHTDRIIGSDELLERFWSSVASDHAVHKAIAELRAALGDSVRRQRYIKTIPKRGYKMVAATSSDSAPTVTHNSDFKQKLRSAIEFIDLRQWGIGIFTSICWSHCYG